MNVTCNFKVNSQTLRIILWTIIRHFHIIAVFINIQFQPYSLQWNNLYASIVAAQPWQMHQTLRMKLFCVDTTCFCSRTDSSTWLRVACLSSASAACVAVWQTCTKQQRLVTVLQSMATYSVSGFQWREQLLQFTLIQFNLYKFLAVIPGETEVKLCQWLPDGRQAITRQNHLHSTHLSPVHDTPITCI